MNITTKNLTARDVLQIGVGLFETFTPTDADQDENLGTRVVPREVARFLARLRLLVGVPFAYLVPDSDLLPPESIRFFYLDRAWTDAIVQGALSVSTMNTADRAQLESLYRFVRNEVDEEERLVRAVTDKFPNVSAIHVREALAAFDRLVGTIGNAVRLTALVALAAGTLVLGGAIAAGHHRRVYDAVVLKVLGATRAAVIRAFLIEHGLLGALTALVACAFGTLAAYLLVTRLIKIEWVFVPVPLLWTAGIATLLTLALGFAGTWRALGAKAAPYLRNE